MKKILVLFSAIIALAGCSSPEITDISDVDDGTGKNGKLTVSVNELRFPASGGVQTFTVTSPDKNWDAGSYYIFLKCTTSGNTVTVTADANTGSEERTGSIIVTAGEESLEVAVIQEAKGGGSGGVNDPAGTADGYNPYPEYSFKVCENTMFLRDTVAQAITSANLENNTFTLSQNTPPEFVPQVGDYYIVNNRMDLFPDGMLMGIQEVRQTADGYSVVYYPVGLGSAFRDLEIQEQDIDISPYIRYIIDSDGNEVPFTRTRAVNTEKMVCNHT